MLALRELDPARLRRLACRLQPVQREQMLQTVVALAEADDEQLAGTFTRGLGAEARDPRWAPDQGQEDARGARAAAGGRRGRRGRERVGGGAPGV